MTTDTWPIAFDNLRAVAIAAAQDASGHVWTDYNLHDPGVTLLEQTLFGLTEVAYMGDHTLRDLLTGPGDEFVPENLGLFPPAEVLPGRPVTRDDLASALSDIDGVDRVFVRNGPTSGLVDLVVIPDDTPRSRQQKARDTASRHAGIVSNLRTYFLRNRLLGQDIHRITIARAQPVVLHGILDISDMADPARVLAGVIHQIRLLLKGLPADLPDGRRAMGATRADVFDDANRMRRGVAADAGDANRFAGILATLRRIPGLIRVSDFALIDTDEDDRVSHKSHASDVYYDPILPESGQGQNLIVTRDGTPISLDANAIAEELGRLHAARISQLGNRKDETDWDVLRPGRHRTMARLPLDATLPAPYARTARAQHQDGAGAPSLSQYRAMIGDHLDTMTAPLVTLPDSYALTPVADLHDPGRLRARVDLLDYLIGLQGAAMPAVDACWMHPYRGVQERLAWQVRWRETYLAALPRYHYHSGTVHPDHGFGAHLAHLADIRQGGPADLRDSPDQALRIDAKILPPQGTIDPANLISPSRPADMLVTRLQAEPLSLQKLVLACPWIVDRTTTPALVQRATVPDAYRLARNSESDWEVMFQPPDGGPLYACGSNQSRAKAEIWANRLRVTFAMINQQAEHLWVVEDMQLRAGSNDYAPASAVCVLPGWTARSALPGYRRHVADMIEQLAPAHVHVRPLWLDWDAMAWLHPLIAAWHAADPGSGPALRAALRDLQAMSDT